MLGSLAHHRQETTRAGTGSSRAGGEQAEYPQQGHDEGWGHVLACHDRIDYPSTCIFWCAIALGALVQGRSSGFVSDLLLNTKPIAAAVA